MAIWIALMVGIIVGWLLKWLIDWAKVRRGLPSFSFVETELQRELDEVRANKEETNRTISRLHEQVAALEVEKQAAGEMNAARRSPEAVVWPGLGVADQQDDVQTTIRRLQEQVAAVTADLESAVRQTHEADSRVAAAVAERDEMDKRLAAALALEDGLRHELEAVQQKYGEAQAAVSQLQGQVAALSAERVQLDTRLSDALALSQAVVQKRRNDLEQIRGIGPVYEQKLFAAGIETFAQIAATPAERLREIIQPASWQRIDFEDWIEQARKSAEVVISDLLPYRLEEIRGIGPAYAKRLNAAGLMTFADLAHTSEKRLREVIMPKPWQAIDFAGWIKEARAFAALTTGDRPPLPLEQIKGIGPVFATRLDLAGIKTLEDLARCSEQELHEIVGKRGVQITHLSQWIAEARAEVAAARPQPPQAV
jgi:predicted flap endonuclease-1-like 5' DNA nuclease